MSKAVLPTSSNQGFFPWLEDLTSSLTRLAYRVAELFSEFSQRAFFDTGVAIYDFFVTVKRNIEEFWRRREITTLTEENQQIDQSISSYKVKNEELRKRIDQKKEETHSLESQNPSGTLSDDLEKLRGLYNKYLDGNSLVDQGNFKMAFSSFAKKYAENLQKFEEKMQKEMPHSQMLFSLKNCISFEKMRAEIYAGT